MTARDIHEHFRAMGTWVDWKKSVDGVHFGNQDAEVRGIAVGWKPYWSELRKAHDLGCNFFLAHESIFREGGAGDETAAAEPAEQGKLAWLRDSGMVVYRCHDVWDVVPGIGVRDSWSRGLGFSDPPLRLAGYYQVVDVKGHTVDSLARHVARKMRDTNQPGLLVVGDGQKPVSRLGLGTGAAFSLKEMLALAADVWIVCDDYFRFVRDGAFLRDIGMPFLVANHGAKEEWGMRNLARHAEGAFPSVPVRFLPQGCPWRMVASEEA